MMTLVERPLPESSMDGSRERRCIVSGDILPEGRLVRFAVDPEGHAVPDVEAKLPGRGMWVRAERNAIEQAAAKGLFSRAAGESVKADAGLASRTEARLVERMLDHIGLARRAGDLILGFDQVERALRGPKGPALIVQAADAAEDGHRKLQAAARSAGTVPFVIGALTSTELSLALGRSNVVHAALKSGRIAERLVFDAGRLNGFRPLKAWVWAGFSEGEAGKAG
jgi:predicted RNA-binding protein YlxR (DUF448 family)/ribosomal protein L30E